MTAAHLAALTALLAVLMLVPFAAGVLLAVRFRATQRTLLVSFGLCGVGLLGITTFGVYLLSASSGRIFAIAATFATLAAAVWAAVRLDGAQRTAVRELVPATALWLAYSMASVALGYLHGGVKGHELTAQFRYTHPLPYDNALPFWLAQQMQSSHRPLPATLPPHGVWQGSDRPPLQTGIYLAEQAFLRADTTMLNYQILGVLAQSLWIFGLWALLRAARRGTQTVALGLAAAMFSGFTIVNTFFTWPKLLAATFLLALAAMTLTADFEQLSHRRAAGWAAGLLAGFALLSHTGSFFGLAAIAVTMLIIRRALPARSVMVAIIGVVVLFGPWMLYQRYYDPPGNHLTWLQLAPLTPQGERFHRGLLSMVIESYQRAGFSWVLHAKLENLATPFHGIGRALSGTGTLLRTAFNDGARATTERNAASIAIRDINYYDLIASFGLYALGPVMLLIATWRQHGSGALRAFRVEWLLLLCVGVCYVVWALVLFNPGWTVIHQGSYFLNLVGFTVGVLGWWALSHWATYLVVGIQSLWTMWIYSVLTPTRTGPGTPLTARVDSGNAVLVIAAVVACLSCLYWMSRARAREPASVILHKPPALAMD